MLDGMAAKSKTKVRAKAKAKAKARKAPPTSTRKIGTSLTLSPDVIEALASQARATDRSVSYVADTLLREALVGGAR